MSGIGLSSLEMELLAQVIEFVDDSSPHTIKSAALVSKQFNDATKLVGHRRKTLVLNGYLSAEPSAPVLVSKWLADPSILSGMRHLWVADGDIDEYQAQVTGRDQIKTHVEAQSRAIVKLLSKAGNLKSLTWDSENCIGVKVLEALKAHHPNAQLILQLWHPVTSPQNADFEETAEYLSSYTQLTALRARNVNDGRYWDEGKDIREQTFRRIASTAPSLKHASILAINSPDVLPHARYCFPAWDGPNYSKYYKHTHPNSCVRTLTLDGFSLSKKTLDDWGRFVDLNQLEELKCTRGRIELQYFQLAPTLLPNLHHISLNLAAMGFGGQGTGNAISNLISTCHPLESLSLWSWEPVALDLILTHHGKSLRALQLHEREPVFPGTTRRTLNLDEIKQVGESCPLLEDLTIDMDRAHQSLTLVAEEENMAKFKAIANFGNGFGRLQVYFDVGMKNLAFGHFDADADDDDLFDRDSLDENLGEEDDDEDTAHRTSAFGIEERHLRGQPPSTIGAVRSFVALAWREIFGTRQHNTGRTELDVKFGEWERKFGGAFGTHEAWISNEERNKSFWQVRPSERDDRKDCKLVEWEEDLPGVSDSDGGEHSGETLYCSENIACIVKQMPKARNGLAW